MPDAAKPLLDDMRAVAKEAFGDDAAKSALPYKTDEETGELTFKTKSKYQPRFVDASGKGVDPGSMPVVYGGSEARLAGNIQAYNAQGNKGVTLQLAAVQVISLAERQGGADFGAEGFVASMITPPVRRPTILARAPGRMAKRQSLTRSRAQIFPSSMKRQRSTTSGRHVLPSTPRTFRWATST